MRTTIASTVAESETLRFHREMYERRRRKTAQRGGLTEKELIDQANDPSLFHKEPPSCPPKADTNGD
jgi:hypothetical protein